MRRLTVTRSGIGLAVGAVLLYAGGFILGYDLLLSLSIGALALLGAGAVAVAVRPTVSLSREVQPSRITVGESGLGRLDVRNISRWPSPAFTAIDLVGDEALPLPIGAVPGHGRRTVHYPVPGVRRGRLRLGPLTVERRDPLGLFAWRQRQTGDDVLWVHPRVHALRPLPVGVVLDYDGQISENARRGTVTFSSLREYVPGDDPRQIHWRSTARTGTLIVREHVDTAEPTTTVVLDTAATDPDAFEESVELAASVARAVEEVGRPVALHIVGERPQETVAAGATGLLDRLALARASAGDVTRVIETADRALAGGALVVITGPVGADALGRLAEQRRRFSPVVVAMVDPAAQLPGIRRRPGLVLLTARSAVDGAGAWQRMLSGDIG
jgi:uncharacterized protein (DUF58 family)